MLFFPMNVLLECLMLNKLILDKVTTQKQEDKLWTMGEECVFSLHAHYLSFIIQWKHNFFSPVSLILFLLGNNFSFSSAALVTNDRLLSYNGQVALLEQNINNNNKKDPCPATCNALLSTFTDNSSQHMGLGEQSRHIQATTWRGGGCRYSKDSPPLALFLQFSSWKHLRTPCMRQQSKMKQYSHSCLSDTIRFVERENNSLSYSSS